MNYLPLRSFGLSGTPPRAAAAAAPQSPRTATFEPETLLSDGELLHHYNSLLGLEQQLERCSVQATGRFALPKIIVLGDQSAGKSSVLEAICGVTLPRDVSTCTRCPIFISTVYVPGAMATSYHVSIKYADRTEGESKSEEIQLELLEDKLREMMQTLAPENGLEGGFTRNAILVEIRRPAVTPPLTLVDLPGFRVEDLHDPQKTHEKIRAIVEEYVKDDSHILHVVDVNHDITTVHSTSELNKMDPHWESRTTTVLTKCDKLAQSERGIRFREWNQRVRSRSHAHQGFDGSPEVYTIRCPSADERRPGAEGDWADVVEKSYHAWRQDLDQAVTTPIGATPAITFGVQPLIQRLSQILIQKIKDFFSDATVHSSVFTELHNVGARLLELGPSLANEENKRSYWAERRNRLKKLRRQLFSGDLKLEASSIGSTAASLGQQMSTLELQLTKKIRDIGMPGQIASRFQQVPSLEAEIPAQLVDQITQQLVDQSSTMHVPGLVNAADILRDRVEQMASAAEGHILGFVDSALAIARAALFEHIVNSPQVLLGQPGMKGSLTSQLMEKYMQRSTALKHRAKEQICLAKDAYIAAQGELGRAVFEHRQKRFGSPCNAALADSFASRDPSVRMRPCAEELALVLMKYWELTHESIVTNVRKLFNGEILEGLLKDDFDAIVDQAPCSLIVETQEISSMKASLREQYRVLRTALQTIETVMGVAIFDKAHDLAACLQCQNSDLEILLALKDMRPLTPTSAV